MFKKIIFLFFISLGIFFLFIPVGQAFLGPIVPACGEKLSATGTITGRACTLCDLFALIKNVIDFLRDLAVVLVPLIVVYGAILFMTAGGSEERLSRAKNIVSSALIGFGISMLAWLIISTVVQVIANPSVFPNPLGKIKCEAVVPGLTQNISVPQGGGTHSGWWCPNSGNPGIVTDLKGGNIAHCEQTERTLFGVNDVNKTCPYAVPDLAKKLTAANDYSFNQGWFGFNVTEGCPPFVQHISSGHYNGHAVDVNVKVKKGGNTDLDYQHLCLALRHAGLTSLVNEAGGICNSGACQAACGTPKTFETTTGAHIHIND